MPEVLEGSDDWDASLEGLTCGRYSCSDIAICARMCCMADGMSGSALAWAARVHWKVDYFRSSKLHESGVKQQYSCFSIAGVDLTLCTAGVPSG